MEKYIGTKIIKAKPMNRQEYNDYRGWDLPEDEDGSDKGYLVEYVDSPDSNHPNHDNYISWSPKMQFERAYRQTNGISFGLAIEAAKLGNRIARKGWNGKNMFVVYMPPLNLPPYSTQYTTQKVNDRTAKWIGEDSPLKCQPYFAMYTADKKWQPGWLASQTDMLADDWIILD